MPYFAAAISRTPHGWFGRELDLDDAVDLDAAADLLRDLHEEAAASGPTLLFVEENDEWFAVVRVDGERDPRVFISDRRAAETSAVAARLFVDVAAQPVSGGEEDEEQNVKPGADPAGDADLLADLGSPRVRLLELCAEEGLLPADVISELCEQAGALEQLEELREG